MSQNCHKLLNVSELYYCPRTVFNEAEEPRTVFKKAEEPRTVFKVR